MASTAGRLAAARLRTALHPAPGDPALPLFIAALALRPAIIGIGPIAGAMAADLRVPHAFVALLATIPVVCMGLFAPLGPYVATRLGDRAAVALGLLVIAVAGALRGAAASALEVVALTVAVGVATGATGALPAYVGKLRAASDRTTIAAAASATGIVVGATFAAAIAGPIALDLGGWRPAVLLMGLVCMVPAAAWLFLVRPVPRRVDERRGSHPHVWRRPIAWTLALAYGLQGIVYWGANAWLPAAFVERGWSAADAGGLIALLNGATIVGNLSVIALSGRLHRGRQLALSACAIAVGSAALAIDPGIAPLATMVMGLGNGMIYPLLLALTMDVAEDEATAGAIAAFMLLVGYELSALGPVVLGSLRDATGSFRVPLALLAGVGLGVLAPSIALSRSSHRLDIERGELRRQESA